MYVDAIECQDPGWPLKIFSKTEILILCSSFTKSCPQSQKNHTTKGNTALVTHTYNCIDRRYILSTIQ